MNRKKRQKKISVLILLLGITIGYALLSTTLKINGTANIKSNTWDIHFENVVANSESTVTAELPSIIDNATKVTYGVNLKQPGDFYEFTVDAVNEGSINGEITKVSHKIYEGDGVTETTLPSYIKYSILDDETNIAPIEGDLLEAGESKTYRIRIEFDPEATTLPSTDVTYKIVDEITYTQTKKRNKTVEDIIDEIESDPDSHRNPDQSSSNLDIGLDENGNVINLNMWVGKPNDPEADLGNCEGRKYYNKKNSVDEVALGIEDCYTPATSGAQVVNGEVITPIPAYIMFAGTNKFIPVTEIGFAFGNSNRRDQVITKMPHIPNTVKIIGGGFMWFQSVQEVIIPSHIEHIYVESFNNCNISILSFEENSKLKTIEGFYNNNLSGNLVLPQSVTYIGKYAFNNNNLASVTFPSSAEYFNSSFDSNVTINHQY